MKKLSLIAILVVVLTVFSVFFSSDEHVVTRVVDGDTVEVSGYDKNIRLIGIDTAED